MIFSNGPELGPVPLTLNYLIDDETLFKIPVEVLYKHVDTIKPSFCFNIINAAENLFLPPRV